MCIDFIVGTARETQTACFKWWAEEAAGWEGERSCCVEGAECCVCGRLSAGKRRSREIAESTDWTGGAVGSCQSKNCRPGGWQTTLFDNCHNNKASSEFTIVIVVFIYLSTYVVTIWWPYRLYYLTYSLNDLCVVNVYLKILMDENSLWCTVHGAAYQEHCSFSIGLSIIIRCSMV